MDMIIQGLPVSLPNPCTERPGKELPMNKVRKLNDVMLTLKVTPP